jgi:hypothetical protein
MMCPKTFWLRGFALSVAGCPELPRLLLLVNVQ